ncbi:MAG: hypothetical protein C5B43_04540 [Verrucomicrobia bacterium]|nr:MAG: hypothetical protein C5B43_04540 [Verrucomicrobiota bacterium]
MKFSAKYLFIAILLLLITSTAHSSVTYEHLSWASFYTNVGWPLILRILPGFLLLLFPISFIKSLVFKHYEPKTTFKKIFWPIIFTSLLSTIIGIALVWALFWVVELISQVLLIHQKKTDLPTELLLGITVESPWMVSLKTYIPYIKWMISISLVFLLLPFYCISSWLEGTILIKFKAFSKEKFTKKISWRANLASYIFLVLLGLIFLLWLYIKSLNL